MNVRVDARNVDFSLSLTRRSRRVCPANIHVGLDYTHMSHINLKLSQNILYTNL